MPRRLAAITLCALSLTTTAATETGSPRVREVHSDTVILLAFDLTVSPDADALTF